MRGSTKDMGSISHQKKGFKPNKAVPQPYVSESVWTEGQKLAHMLCCVYSETNTWAAVPLPFILMIIKY